MVAYNGYLYLAGGVIANTSNFTVQSNVFSIALNASTGDTSGSWTTAGTLPSLSGVRVYMGSTVVNGRWYLAGGCTSTNCAAGTLVNIIESASFQSAGGLSAWTTTSGAQNLSTGRAGPGLSAYNGYLYVYGGCLASQCTTGGQNDTEYTQITNSGGTITNGWTVVPSGSAPIGGGSSVYGASNGYLYMVGGFDTRGNLKQRTAIAPILANGSVGPWQAVGYDTSSLIGEDRVGASGAIYNGRMYITGGDPGDANGSDPTNKTVYDTTRYATLQSIPRTGSFSKLYDLDAGVKPTKLITRGTKQSGSITGVNYMNTNNASTTFGTFTTIADQAYTGANALSIALGTNITLSRYFFLRYTIDDSYSAVFPDSGSESTITDFDLYYTSNPGKRLRGGRTFTSGSDGKQRDRGLEANP